MVVVVQYKGDEPEADASPIDHVLEKQACEMLRIFKSDGDQLIPLRYLLLMKVYLDAFY